MKIDHAKYVNDFQEHSFPQSILPYLLVVVVDLGSHISWWTFSSHIIDEQFRKAFCESSYNLNGSHVSLYFHRQSRCHENYISVLRISLTQSLKTLGKISSTMIPDFTHCNNAIHTEPIEYQRFLAWKFYISHGILIFIFLFLPNDLWVVKKVILF